MAGHHGASRDKRGHLWMPNANGILRDDGKRFEFLVRPSRKSCLIAFSLLEDPNRNVVLQGSQGVVHIFENQPPFEPHRLLKKKG